MGSAKEPTSGVWVLQLAPFRCGGEISMSMMEPPGAQSAAPEPEAPLGDAPEQVYIKYLGGSPYLQNTPPR